MKRTRIGSFMKRRYLQRFCLLVFSNCSTIQCFGELELASRPFASGNLQDMNYLIMLQRRELRLV